MSTKSHLRWFSIVCGLGFASATWGAPRTHLLVPSGQAPELEALAQNAGAVAELMTVTGDDYLVTLTAGSAGAVHGTELDGNHADLSVPFESLALVYYTNPSRNTKKPRPTPEESRYPRVSSVGKAEREMSCEALDVELARADAVRWFARARGALPYTHAEAIKVHARNVGVGFGIAVAAVFIAGAMADCPVCFGGAGGWGGGGGHGYAVPPEKLRFAVTAADERIAGLLQLKSEKSCAALPSLQEGTTDLELWSKVSSVTAATESAEDADRIALLARTEAFDLLGPKAVHDSLSRNISWLPNRAVVASDDGQGTGMENVWTGSLALAGDDMVLRFKERDPSAGVEEREIRVPFAALESVDLREERKSHTLLLTLRDGQFASVQTDADVRALYYDLRAKLHAAQLTRGAGEADAAAVASATAELAALSAAPARHGSGDDELTAAQ